MCSRHFLKPMAALKIVPPFYSVAAALAIRPQRPHTQAMNLKGAAFLAFIGTLLLTLLLAAHCITTIVGIMRNIVPFMALLPALIHFFASLTATLFFFVFFRKQ